MIPACASSSSVFLMMYSAYKLNKRGDNIQPYELTTNPKNHHFEVSPSLILRNNNEPFLDQIVTCDEKDFISQLTMTSSVVRPRRSPTALPKAKLAPQKGHGHCSVVCCPSDPLHFLLMKPLHLRRMLSKSMTCTKNCNACSQQWSTEWAQFSMTTSDCMSHNQHFESWTNRAMKFCPVHHIHQNSRQPTTTSLGTWLLSAGKTLPQAAGGRSCFPRVCRIPKHGFLR